MSVVGYDLIEFVIILFMQRVKSTARKNLQLVGVAAMFLASKYEELYPPEVNEFVYITDNTYSKEQILQMEKHIFKVGGVPIECYFSIELHYKFLCFHFYLQCLEYQVNAPTSILFLRRFSKAANADSATHSMAKYFIESASIDYNLSEYLPSEVSKLLWIITKSPHLICIEFHALLYHLFK